MYTLKKLWRELPNKNIASLMLRLGLAFTFIYAAVSSFLEPNDWVGFLPAFLLERVDGALLLKIFSLYEFVLAAWLLSGIYARCAGLLCALTMLGIVLANPSVFIISFRDVGLAFAGLALAFSKET